MEALVGAPDEREHRVLLPGAIRPVLQANEYQAGILAVTAEAEAIDGKYSADEVFLILEEVVTRLIQRPLSQLTGGARRRGHLDKEKALVFSRQKGCGHPYEQ